METGINKIKRKKIRDTVGDKEIREKEREREREREKRGEGER